MTNYEWAHEDEIDLVVNIDWSDPVTHDVLNYGLVESDDTAYLYAIIGFIDGEWWTYYIGMVYAQDVSSRHKNPDHIKRFERLKKLHPETTWHLTLGTPTVKEKRITEGLVKKIEGLLIYSHWHYKSVNDSKINSFFCDKSISLTNSGFSDPFYSKVAFGTLVSE